jgi:citrate synthase
VDGTAGRLKYRGIDVQHLAEGATFEEVAFLLWQGELPTQRQLDELSAQMDEWRELPGPVLDMLRSLPPHASCMDALRTGVSMLGPFDPERGDNSIEANKRKAIRLLTQVPVVVAAFARLSEGKDPVPPVKGPVAAAFLEMLFGERPDPAEARVLDKVLVLQADHEFNASAFSARVIAATLSDLHSALAGAISALAGPLHGAANAAVMEMLVEIGSPENAERWVLDKLARRERVMGFGHPIYKTSDPRTPVLREMSQQLSHSSGHPEWFEMSQILESVMLREKDLIANVDFYSATVYAALDIPVGLFAPMFAISRTSGWTAHVLEQLADNRLIRPSAEYVGPDARAFVPIEQRG